MYKVEIDFGEKHGWWECTTDAESVLPYIESALKVADEDSSFKVVVTITKEVHGK